MSLYIPRLPPGLGAAFWLALALVFAFELALHSEAVMHRYRAVFAVGRAMDKLQHVERHPPALLFIGNSRTDNGIDPRAVAHCLGWPAARAFNLGLPGANAVIYQGLIKRLGMRGLLGDAGIQTVVLGLDESALQEDDSLGYIPFFADRRVLWNSGRHGDWLGSHVRLWSYSGNLRQLREPEKALRFAEATFRSIDPVGGGAGDHLGYRAGFGAAQNEGQVARQEQAAQKPPADSVASFLWQAIDLLQRHDVRVVVAVPPLRDRPSAFYDPDPAVASYRGLLGELHARGVTVLQPMGLAFEPDEFVNAGHLNDRGAQRYSRALAAQLTAIGVK
jgi:hypothetical protein